TSIPEKEELIELGKDLLDWASEKKKGELRCRWCEWYAKKHFFIRKQWKRMVDTEEFRPYYEAAQVYLGEKWIDGTINQAIAQRYLRIYDPELKENEDIDADEKEVRRASALKNEVKAIEEEKQKVLKEVGRNKKAPA
ncbi:MAG TPA: hypothetical protein VMR37_03585, partial [Rhabdochlamydiaceae bacterium]|nr:hypothetical protein [Rhabdochlamydiaceae bacterium]